jgi:uncharacterized protein with FMN-binding domain
MKKKYLAIAGFAIGTGSVLIASPPEFLSAPETSIKPVAPVASETPVASATPVNSQTPVTSETPVTTPTPSQTVTTTPIPTKTPVVTPVTSQTINGAVYAAGKYGDVQVQIVIKSGVITSAKALIFPNADSRSSSISATAIPILIKQTLAAQSAVGIDGASGASYTSDAWISSLQSALAKA